MRSFFGFFVVRIVIVFVEVVVVFSLVVFTFPLAFSLLLGVRTAVAALSSSHHGILPGFVAVLGTPVGFQDGCQHTQIVLVNATFRSVVGMGFLVWQSVQV